MGISVSISEPSHSSGQTGAFPWRERERPLRLERRLIFSSYESTRIFLEQSEKLSEEMSIYPNMNFGRTYVNLTLFAEEGADQIGGDLRLFADRIDELSGDNPPPATRADDPDEGS